MARVICLGTGRARAVSRGGGMGSLSPLRARTVSLQKGQQKLTMSTTFAITRMKMANMAQVFLAQRVRSIQVEKATSFLGKA